MITIRNNHGDIKTCTEAELLTARRKGWLPVREDKPAFDPATQQLVAGTWENTGTEWVRHWTIIAITVDQQAIWQGKLAAGYQDPAAPTGTGLKLKLTDSARSQFKELSIGIVEALDLGVATADTQQVIWDFDDQPHALTVLQIRALLLRYRMFYGALFSEFAP